MEPQRTITVFLSCPGDLTKAKDELTSVVYEVANHFRPLGLHIVPWRHDPQAVPGIGEDAQAVVARQMPRYEIYVGLLCQRLGTPTNRALSGTMEEFMDAQQHYLDAGRPDILFYFCNEPEPATNPDEEQQLAKVREFRNCFPGLFATFHTLSDLRVSFKGHLIDLILREVANPKPPSRAWARALATHLDNSSMNTGYLDRTSRFVVRTLEKLYGLFDLPSVLNANECNTLLGACYLRAFALSGVSDSFARTLLGAVPEVGLSLEEAAVEISALAAERINPREDALYKDVRCSFLAALLQLGEVLDLDHDTIVGELRPPYPPPTDSELSCWLAYCTKHIGVRRPGLVQFQILLARDQECHRKMLSRSYALIFEATWQRLRRILTANNVALSRAPLQLSLSAISAPFPASVLLRLQMAAEAAAQKIPELIHLSQESASWPLLADLLPLPRSAILTQLRLRWDPLRDCIVRIRRTNGAGVLTIRPSIPGEISIPATALASPVGVYRWELVEDFGDFQSSPLACGDVWMPPQPDRFRMDASVSGDSSLLQSWRFSLGLWNDVLTDLWPRLVQRTGTRNEALLVYDILLGSYEWLRKNAPACGQIDRFRNAANLVHTTYIQS